MNEPEGGDVVEDERPEPTIGETSGSTVLVIAIAVLIAATVIYNFWGPITTFLDNLFALVFALAIFVGVGGAVWYALREIFERKNVAAALFVVGILAIAAWLVIRFMA